MERKSEFRSGPLTLAAGCLAILSAVGVAAWPQASALNITLAGQSMIRGDIRIHTPGAVAAISPLSLNAPSLGLWHRLVGRIWRKAIIPTVARPNTRLSWPSNSHAPPRRGQASGR